VSTNEKGEGWNSNLSSLMFALEKGMYSAGILFVACAAIICGTFNERDDDENMWESFACVIIGLVAGICIGKLTECKHETSF
jgi:Na+/H+-translocating membrane pyrophosphatase